MEIKIVDINGWSKLFEVKKAITQLGSASTVDIQLLTNSIAPLQLQILANPSLPTGCRIVNMSEMLEVRRNNSEFQLESHKFFDINSGDELQLGEYKLVFVLPLTAVQQQASNIIGATIVFQDTILQPYLSLDGLLTIKNCGKKDACQFQVEIAGLPEDCCRIDPIPLLYPGAQEDVRIRLFHKICYPQAGYQNLLISVKAPETYPGEAVVIRQGIYVAPVFSHTIEITDSINFEQENLNVTSQIAEEDSIIQPVYSQPDRPEEVSSSETSVEETQSSLEPLIEEKSIPPSIQNGEEKQTNLETETSGIISQPVAPKRKKTKKAQPVEDSAQESTRTEDPSGDEPSEQKNVPDTHELDLTKVKVVRKQADQYWDDK